MSTDKILGERYRVGKVIGAGAFSVVYECHDMDTNMRYAVKVLNKAKVRQADMEEAFEREAMALRSLTHSKHVTVAFDILQSTRNYYVVMELADKGNLLQLVVKTNGGHGLPNHAVRHYFSQLLMGVRDMHACDIVHRDIKPENLLLDDHRNVKISDFGFAAQASKTRILRRQCGTPQYVAPEVLKGEGYVGHYADIWSSGVTLYVLLCGQLPFAAPDHDRLFEQIQSGHYPTPRRPSGLMAVPSAALHLLKCCLCLDPTKRWSAEQLLKHPYLNGMDDVVIASESIFSNLGTSFDLEMISKLLPATEGPTPVLHASHSMPNVRELAVLGERIYDDPQLGRRKSGKAFALRKKFYESCEVLSDLHDRSEDTPNPTPITDDYRREGLGKCNALKLLKQASFTDEPVTPRVSSTGLLRPEGGFSTSRTQALSTDALLTTSTPTPLNTLTKRPTPTKRSTPTPRRDSTTPVDPARFTKPLRRRFGVVHLWLITEFVVVCLAVLVVALLKLMFDIKMEVLPKRVREMFEWLVDGMGSTDIPPPLVPEKNKKGN